MTKLCWKIYIRTENSYNITVLSVQKFLAMRIINQN